MGLMTEIKIRNFMGFREPVSIKLSQSTYFVGANNSGKSTILKAMVCFFDSNEFRHDKLNKSEQASRGGGANRSEITVGFDLSLISIAKKKRLSRKYGDILEITKTFTVKEISRNIVVEYSCGNEKKKPFEELDADVQALLKAVRISYLHPQEGPELLLRAQSKFKERLFANWGRHASMAKNIGEAQAKWEELRTLATDYLSSALTESVQRLWPGSETKVDLPAKIEDVVGISDITFKNDKDQPAITLSEQGTGAQSSILYQTHYILDGKN
jgi:energy-coupling factor transporter ATP-binding protein EcfA2